MSLHRATSLFQLTNNIKRKDSMNEAMTLGYLVGFVVGCLLGLWVGKQIYSVKALEDK